MQTVMRTHLNGYMATFCERVSKTPTWPSWQPNATKPVLARRCASQVIVEGLTFIANTGHWWVHIHNTQSREEQDSQQKSHCSFTTQNQKKDRIHSSRVAADSQLKTTIRIRYSRELAGWQATHSTWSSRPRHSMVLPCGATTRRRLRNGPIGRSHKVRAGGAQSNPPYDN